MSSPRRRALALCAAAVVPLVIGVLVTLAVSWTLPWFARFPASTIGQVHGGIAFRNGAADVHAWEARGIYRVETTFAPYLTRAGGASPDNEEDYPPTPLTPAGKFDERLVMRLCDDYPLESRMPHDGSTFARSGLTRSRAAERSGWPWLAMESELRGHRGLSRDGTPTVAFGIPIASAQPVTRPFPGALRAATIPVDRLATVPLRPIWPGFALNTALYGGCVWALFFLPRSLRRRARKRRGACERCGYDRHGLATPDTPCPECGRQDAAAATARAARIDSPSARFARGALLSLALGAAITVVSAWACSLLVSFTTPGGPAARGTTITQHGEATETQASLLPTDATVSEARVFTEQAPGIARRVAFSIERGVVYARLRDSAGWPLPALQLTAAVNNGCADHVEWRLPAPRLSSPLFTVTNLELIDDGLLGVPLRPTWPGFIVNTLVFAGLVGLALFARARVGCRSAAALDS